MTDPLEPVTLRQIFSAVQGLRADVQKLTESHELTRRAVVHVQEEQARIAAAQIVYGDEMGERVNDLRDRVRQLEKQGTNGTSP
jgi:uncharacterized protein YoxC